MRIAPLKLELYQALRLEAVAWLERGSVKPTEALIEHRVFEQFFGREYPLPNPFDFDSDCHGDIAAVSGDPEKNIEW